MSKQSELTKISFTKGYRVSTEGYVVSPKGKIINTSISTQGYSSFNIRHKNLVTRSFVHRLQAYQKFGDKIFKSGIVVRHLNGNSLDNSWENIVIGTQSDNIKDICPSIRKSKAIKASRKMQDTARSFEERCKIYEDLKNKVPYSEIMKRHNVSSKGTLSFMKNKSEEYKEYIAD